MNKRVIGAVLILALVSTSLSGCGAVAGADKNGEMLRLTEKELLEQGRNGIFVLNKDETFTPLVTGISGYQGKTTESSESRYLWYTDNDINITNLIPVVTKDTPLVIVYTSTSSIPSLWYLEKYEDRGYTVGVHFHTNDLREVYIDVDSSLSGSNAGSILDTANLPDPSYALRKVNDSEKIPLGNIDPNMRMFLGLSKDQFYTFQFYRGTFSTKATFYADTRAFQSEDYIELTSPIKKTDEGYFIINLPLNLQPGFYYINNLGFFEYRTEGDQ